MTPVNEILSLYMYIDTRHPEKKCLRTIRMTQASNPRNPDTMGALKHFKYTMRKTINNPYKKKHIHRLIK